MKISASILIIAILLPLCCLAGAAIPLEILYTQTNVYSRQPVDSSSIGAIDSFSIEGWVRPQMRMLLSEQPFSVISQNNSPIFGVSSSKSGWAKPNASTDNYLYASLKAWSQGEGFLAGFESNKNMKELLSPVPFSDQLGRWSFLYIAYHGEEKKVYFVVKNDFSSTYQEQWSDQIVKNPLNTGYFQFSIGSGVTNQAGSLNGYVSNVAFKPYAYNVFHKTISQLDSYLKDVQYGQLGDLTYRAYRHVRDASTISSSVTQLSSGYGAEEYAISGYFQLPAFKSSTKDVLLYRFSAHNPNGNYATNIEGDRALYGYLEKGLKICFGTYSLGLKAVNVAITTCFPDVNPGTNEFFFYQGYSRQYQSVQAYLKIGEKTYYQKTEQIVHMDNYCNWLYLGDDGFTVRSTGQYRSIKVEFGNGSYREDLDPQSQQNGSTPSSSFISEEVSLSNEKQDQFHLNSAKVPSLHKRSLRKKSHSHQNVLQDNEQLEE